MRTTNAHCIVAFTKPPVQPRPGRCRWPRIFRFLVLVSTLLLPSARSSSADSTRQVDIDCLRIDLAHQSPQERLFWVNSGIWLSRAGEARLLLLDSLRDQLAEITPPSGHRRAGVRVFSKDALRDPDIETPLLVRSTPGADKAVLEFPGSLFHFATDLQPGDTLRLPQARRIPLGVQVSGQGLRVDTLWNWQLTSSASGLFAYADLCEDQCDHPEDWVSTFIYWQFKSPDNVEPPDNVLSFDLTIGFGDDIREFYLESRDYLAVLGKVAYLLDFIHGTPRLIRLSVSSEGRPELQSLPDFPRFRAPLDLDGIMRLRAPQIATDYYRRIQAQAIPTGLYAWDGELYLLAKAQMDAYGETDWWLTRVDPRTGAALSEVKLPSKAASLLPVPGRQWALVERSEIQGRGPLQFPFMETQAVVLLPEAQLTDSLQTSPQRTAELVCRPPM